MSNKAKVFIVILNWNRAADTIECIKSVIKLQVTGYELGVIIVDNASSDNSVEEITRNTERVTQKHIDIKVIKNKENLGFAGGNNVGMKYALENGADYIMVLNNDTIVDSELMYRYIETADKYKGVAVFSPKIYFAPGFEFHKDRYEKREVGKVIWSAGGSMDWKNVFGKNKGVNEIDNGQYEEELEIDFATGACIFIRAEALKDAGYFDEKYFMYFEDADLCQRKKKAGWKILYIPKAKLWHKVAQSSGIGSGLNDYYIARNRLLFGMRYAPLRSKFALIKESLKLLASGRPWQKIGVRDFYLGRFGKGSWRS